MIIIISSHYFSKLQNQNLILMVTISHTCKHTCIIYFEGHVTNIISVTYGNIYPYCHFERYALHDKIQTKSRFRKDADINE